MEYLWNVTQFILHGSIVTFQLFVATVIFSVPLGIVLALGRVSRFKIVREGIGIYTWVFRGTPLLLQLYFTYFGLPAIGIKLDAFSAAVLAFTINYAAYLTEIFRSGIESIEKGQYEAAKVLGMNYWQTMKRIILPQGLKRVLPPACNEAITLVKDTALVATIAMGDILRATKEVVARDFTISPFFIAAVLYLLITSVIVYFFRKVEEKYSVYE